MIHPFFRDQSIYEKCKQTIYTSCSQIEQEPIIVEIQYLEKCDNWHSMLPTDNHFERLEEYKKSLSDPEEIKEINTCISWWSKYRKGCKRKEYTIEEFNKIFYIP